MRRRKSAEGRYTVGDKAVPSLGAAIAYAMSLAMQLHQTQYVREIGREGTLYRAEYVGPHVVGSPTA